MIPGTCHLSTVAICLRCESRETPPYLSTREIFPSGFSAQAAADVKVGYFTSDALVQLTRDVHFSAALDSDGAATVTRIDPQTRGVAAVVPIGVDRAPNEIAASDQAAWVANEDGTLSRIDETATSADSLWVGGAVRGVAVAAGRVWVATSALDQQLQGGRG